jgi:hypothetical protein
MDLKSGIRERELDLTKHFVQKMALVNTVMNLRDPYDAMDFCKSYQSMA